PVLVHRLRRKRRAHPVRAGALLRLGRTAGRTAGLRGLRRRRDGTQTRPRAGRRALERVPARPPLPGDGGPRPAGSGLAGLLRATALAVRKRWSALRRWP